MTTAYRRAAGAVLLFVICTASDCYSVKHDGNVTVASFSGTVLGILYLVTIAVVAVGVVMCRQEGYWEKGIIVAGVAVMFAIFILPGIFLDQVRMDEKGVHQRTGFWFMPTRKGFDYSELSSVAVSEVEKRHTVETQWTLYLKNGGTRVLDPGDLWDACAAEVIQSLMAKKIPVEIR